MELMLLSRRIVGKPPTEEKIADGLITLMPSRQFCMVFLSNAFALYEARLNFLGSFLQDSRNILPFVKSMFFFAPK
jgi:hypothetical protein